MTEILKEQSLETDIRQSFLTMGTEPLLNDSLNKENCTFTYETRWKGIKGSMCQIEALHNDRSSRTRRKGDNRC